MIRTKILIIVVLIGLASLSIPQETMATEHMIPEWIRQVAGWWSEGSTSDDEYKESLKWLIENGIIPITQIAIAQREHGTITSDDIADGTITLSDMDAFVPLVPIGAVLDWYCTDNCGNIPRGFEIADGRILDERLSTVFDGKPLPDLRDKFVLGTGDTSLVGQAGGSINHSHEITGPNDSEYPANIPSSLSRSGLNLSSSDHQPPYIKLLKIIRVF